MSDKVDKMFREISGIASAMTDQKNERREFWVYGDNTPIKLAMDDIPTKENSEYIKQYPNTEVIHVKEVGAGLCAIEDVKELLEALEYFIELGCCSCEQANFENGLMYDYTCEQCYTTKKFKQKYKEVLGDLNKI